MPKTAKKTYTPEEKAALVAEVRLRYQAGGLTYKAITDELGITEANYYSWAKTFVARPPEPAPAPSLASKKPRPPRPYPPTERQRLIDAVERFRAQGHTTESACQAAGLSDSTYRKWRVAAAPAPAMRPVEITALVPAMPAAPAAAEMPLSLVTPGGYRVEGLNVASAAQLLRALQ